MRLSKFHYTLTLMLFFFLSGSIMAQKNFTKDADAAYTNGNYFNAIELYKKAYSKERKAEEKKRILYHIGMCYFNLQDEVNAEEWLGKAVKAGYKDPAAQFYYAESIMQQGQYDRALVEFKKYKEMKPNDPMADLRIKSCEQAQEWLDHPTRYKVQPDPLINSKQSDFSPAWGDKYYQTIIFTSTREGAVGNDIDEITGQSFSSLWITKKDKKSGKFETPRLLDEGVINTADANEGSSTMNKRRSVLYFTRCAQRKNKIVGCEIYSAKKMGKGWAEPEMIKLLPDDTSSAGHPSVGLNDMYMFFASDMPGGYGGKDIWLTKYDKKSKTWGKPVNLGPNINTEGNEMFPFIHNDGRLFFASDGRVGMGGLDIYVAERQGKSDKWGNVENLKSPINSPGNDFAIIFEGNKNRGYFTTDRDGGRGSDDLWMFWVPPLKFIIAGTVTDLMTGEPIPGATVKLIGTDGSQVEMQTDELGYYEFDAKEGSGERYVKPETSYTLDVTKPKYLRGKGQETTVGLEESTKLVHDFKLQPIIAKEIHFPEVRYDLDKWELQVNDSVNSKDSLDYLYQVLIDNPTIVIELMAHTDQRGSDAYNLRLSQKRAETCVNYLVSKGIPKDRMVPKGYGESDPVIPESEILKLPTKEEQEAAYQKNRRTTFRVLRDDYVPQNQDGQPEDDN